MNSTPPYAQASPPAKSSKALWVVLGVIIGVPTILMGGCVACFAILGAVGSQQRAGSSPSTASSYAWPTPPAKESTAPTPCVTVTPSCSDFHQLQVVKSRWEKGGFGTVAVWHVTFRNNGKKPIGNIKFSTSYDAETGSEVDKGGTDSLLGKDTIQKVIEPGKTRTIEVNDGFVHDEAARASFAVVSWEYVR